MANTFRVIVPAGSTAYYVSKAGSDSNDGLTPDTPKATISGVMAAIAALAATTKVHIIVGAGVYEEAISSGSKLGIGSQMVADGQVVLRGNGTNTISLGASPGCGVVGFIIENYATAGFRNSLTNCLIRNCPNVSPGIVGASIDSCQIIGAAIAGRPTLINSVFLDCSFPGGLNNFKSSYFNGNCTITMAMETVTSVGNVDYNNIMGMLRNGTTGNYKSLADFKADYPGYFLNCINLPPKFNNPAKYDFTLQADSPHIGAGNSDGTFNIGGTSYGVPYVAGVAPQWLEPNAVISRSDGQNPDLVMSGTDLILAPGKQVGAITSAPMRISLNPVAIQQMQYNGFLGFNKSQAGGSATNNNVPDANVYAGSAANGGGNPDRLSYEMRWTDNDTMPGSDVDWTVTPIVAPGSFLRFEWNTQPLFDTMGFGNGSASFNKNASPSPVSAVWIQIRVTLTNNYV
ncbi:hypothetical protein KHS38_12185 [Mucilaginibacter sp. Bleaf8]|uniref:hypothetical protein n=1 Tax=Mucilaginibacter sp. Bleaf8 TaxID=2834430 RepID=UPI001BCBD3B3|nr:hypothetical protein [Mucilaginibacter sp. Bleaf8]MBS7565164.1 hypothetical protein [Mucilaginibacter sp. Bleaf8]